MQQCKTKADKRKYEWILVFSGAGLACLESLTMAIGFGRKGLLTKYKWYYVLLITVIWTIMATLTSIIGKIISVKLVGNGISLILVSNILSSYPSDSANIYEVLMKGKKTYIAGLHLFFLLILITALFIFTVWLQDTEKKIPVTYSGKLQGKSTFKGVSTNTIPIKLCPGGVVPIIFASSLISFPILIAQIAGAKQNAVLKLLNSGYWFNTSKPWYTFGALIYLVLIFAFSYFYTEITMNPEEIANNIKKSGGNIAGIRAGSSTAEYLRKQMKYLIAISCRVVFDAGIHSKAVGFEFKRSGLYTLAMKDEQKTYILHGHAEKVIHGKNGYCGIYVPIKRYQNGSFQTVWYLASFFNSNISVVKGDTVFLRGYRISDKSYNGFDYLDLTCSDIIGIHNL